MDQIFLALFEGALRASVGVPASFMFEEIKTAYSDQGDVVSLFEDLIVDWQVPSIHPLKMVGPFLKRVPANSDFIIASAFTELASATTMIEDFWSQAAQAYALKKHILNCRPSPVDCKQAQEILGIFPNDHAIKNYFQTLSTQENWLMAVGQLTESPPNFENWSGQFELSSRPLPFRCFQSAKERAEQMGIVELAEITQQKWDKFSQVLQVC